MSSIQELREKRAAKAREYRNLLDSHTGAIPEEAGKQLDTLEDEISALDDALPAMKRRWPWKPTV